MSGETRTFRPFNIDERLASALEQAEFSYGDLQCGVGERVLIEDRSFGMRSPTLSWSPQHQFRQFKQDLITGIAATGLDASDLCLIVTARSGHLKLCEVAYRPSACRHKQVSTGRSVLAISLTVPVGVCSAPRHTVPQLMPILRCAALSRRHR